MEAHDYPRRILLAVTGLSPQIVTETLFALVRDAKQPFVPTEVHLLTTQEGAERARHALLHPRAGHFHQLCKEYELPKIGFDLSQVHIIKDAQGMPLDDIRTLADNQCAADAITEYVRRLTADPDSALHVSIAGGRKTMGFYMGYALSLFGREQDRLSHVLVSAPYESHPEFYYPTRESRLIYTRGDNPRPYDTREAEVMLAEIPIVRLRDGLPKALTEGTESFSATVAEAQRTLPHVSLRIDVERRQLIAGGEAFNMTPTELAFYWVLMERRKQGEPGVHWSQDFSEDLLAYYGRLVNPNSGDYDKANEALTKGMTKDYINPKKNKTNKLIRKMLGARMAATYEVKTEGRIPGSNYKYYTLSVPADCIELPASLPAQQD